ncbi:MAG: RES family NAD+ phosphorylase [Lentisphaerae bacterium]|nr:RES family NAD+ phosphorylase [Lentisphaerota bacterium]
MGIDEHVFRMVNPRFTRDADIVGGKGGRVSVGRWNLRGSFHCTYTSRTPETALLESLARVRREHLPDEKALPKTLVCIAVRVSRALDLTDGEVRQRLGVSKARMTDEQQWRSDHYHNRESITQAIGRAAATLGYEALTSLSAADKPHGVNVVVFPKNLLSGSLLEVVTPICP